MPPPGVAFDSEELTVSELANGQLPSRIRHAMSGTDTAYQLAISPPAGSPSSSAPLMRHPRADVDMLLPGGPDAESIKFLDGYDDEGVVEDLEMEEDLEEDQVHDRPLRVVRCPEPGVSHGEWCCQEDEIMSREELEHAGRHNVCLCARGLRCTALTHAVLLAGEVLLPMLLNKMTPGLSCYARATRCPVLTESTLLPGGEGVVNKSTANLGTGSLFGRYIAFTPP
eukprot:1012241-Rhodomonas_salina.3